MAEETERLARSLAPGEIDTLGVLDLQRLALENSRRTFQADEPTYGVLACLRHWEVLVRRMEAEWPRQDYYMVYEYLNDLTIRDLIEEFLDGMPPGLRRKVAVVVRRLDSRFRDVTFEDGGAELGQYWRAL
ncbi:hypothetical protein ACFQ07_25740, partial [Actinomadura adrarensis]